MLTIRHANWYKLLNMFENIGKNTIEKQQEFFDSTDESEDLNYKIIKMQSSMYAYQLKSYLRTYTDG